MAGYALAKKRFVGRKLLFTLIVCAMALPKQVILIPLLREMSSLNLYNTIWAVIFPIVGLSLIHISSPEPTRCSMFHHSVRAVAQPGVIW